MKTHPRGSATVTVAAALVCALLGAELAWAQSDRSVAAAPFHAPVGFDRASGIRTNLRQKAAADVLILPAAQVAAVDALEEGFDDITLLPGAGWALTNTSAPVGPSSWFQGNQTIFPAHAGAPNGYIAANYESAGDAGTVSNWLITPEVTIVNGTELRFWTRRTAQSADFPDRLEVRLSVAGPSVDVGGTAESAGDFTELLLTINETLQPGGYPVEWTEYVVTVRGRSRTPVTGRFAFRYWVTDTASNGDYIGIDSVRVTRASAQQFPTSITLTGTGGAVGDARTLTFGSTGVTLTETNTEVTFGGDDNPSCSMGAGGPGIHTQANVAAFTEPDIPADAFAASSACIDGTRTSTLTLNKPLIAPILHLVNLDGSNLDWSGTSTTGAAIEATTIVKNNQMEVTSNRFNARADGAINTGCSTDANPPGNPNGGCGSFRLTAASGFVQSLTFTNSETILSGDGWAWLLSFPTAPLTTAFSPSAIAEGDTSELTFTINNPGGSAAVPLSPLDFTETLPAGVTLASATVTDNGQCGDGLSVTDGEGGALDVGDTSISVSGINLAVGATCTMSVSVTAPEGSYTNAAGNMSSDVGNVVPTGTASFTVTPPGGGGGSETITHSASLDVLTYGPACEVDEDGSTRAGQFLRTFTLTDLGITGPFEVTAVTFGVGGVGAAGGAPVSIAVNLHTLHGELAYNNLTLIGGTTVDLPPQEFTLVTVPVTGQAPAGSTLVVEIAAPELSGVGAFYPGTNDLGETAPSYAASDACGTFDPVPFGELGFPDDHLVMTVTGETQTGGEFTRPWQTSLDLPSASVPGRWRTETVRIGSRSTPGRSRWHPRLR